MAGPQDLVRVADDYGDPPVVLYTTLTVGLNNVVVADSDDLQNHFDTPIVVEEIRFLLFINADDDGVSAPKMFDLGLLVQTYIKMGTIDLTNGFIPIGILGSRLQNAVEHYVGNKAAGRWGIWEYQRWKLPVPTVVLPGNSILPKFSYLIPGTLTPSGADDSTITIHVALVGRALAKKGFPTKGRIKVPYATSFLANATTKGLQSGDDQLVNKFNVPLYVQWLIGEIAVQNTVPNPEFWTNDTGFFSGSVSNPSTRISIQDNSGYYLCQSAFWFDVFDRARRVFPVNGILEPRGWYKLMLEDSPALASFLPMVSLIGWREEELI